MNYLRVVCCLLVVVSSKKRRKDMSGLAPYSAAKHRPCFRLQTCSCLNLPHLTALPKLLLGDSVLGKVGLLAGVMLALLAAGAAGEEDDDGGEKGENGGGEDAPDGGSVGSLVAVDLVDLVLDDAKGDKVAGGGDNGDDEGEAGEDGGEEGEEGVGADAQEEGDEGKDGADNVQDHDAGEALGGVLGGGAKVNVIVDGLEELGGVVADHLVAANVFAAGRELASILF